MKSKMSRATDISPKVRKEVRERDKYCVICGKPGTDLMHYIPRSRGGLGIAMNLVLGCHECHMKQHSSDPEIMYTMRDYLIYQYGDEWNSTCLIYHDPRYEDLPLSKSIQFGGNNA